MRAARSGKSSFKQVIPETLPGEKDEEEEVLPLTVSGSGEQPGQTSQGAGGVCGCNVPLHGCIM